MNTQQGQMIKDEIEKVETQGYGEVIIKIKNGYIWRILCVIDRLLDNKE